MDRTFAPAVAGKVFSVIIQHDGKTLVGGLTVGPQNGSGLARLLEDGTMDPDFEAPLLPFNEDGYGGTVWALAVQRDGKILVGGKISLNENGERAGPFGLVRLHPDGSLDTSFVRSAEPDVLAIRLQPNQQILVGQYGSYHSSHLKRLNPDGSPDLDFNERVTVNDTVTAIDLTAEGKIVLGGTFTTVNGYQHSHLARLKKNGAVDTNFNPVVSGQVKALPGQITLDPDFPFGVRALVVAPGQKILIAGAFESVNGSSRPGVARLNADGSLDADFAGAAGANGRVFTLVTHSSGHVYLGGVFTKVGGNERYHLARLLKDGTVDESFAPALGTEWNVVATLALEGRRLVVGGCFYNPQADRYGGITRLNTYAR